MRRMKYMTSCFVHKYRCPKNSSILVPDNSNMYFYWLHWNVLEYHQKIVLHDDCGYAPFHSLHSIGTLIIILFSDPMVDILDNMGMLSACCSSSHRSKTSYSFLLCFVPHCSLHFKCWRTHCSLQLCKEEDCISLSDDTHFRSKQRQFQLLLFREVWSSAII